MGDRAVVILAEYDEGQAEWRLLSLYSRWGGAYRAVVVLDVLAHSMGPEPQGASNRLRWHGPSISEILFRPYDLVWDIVTMCPVDTSEHDVLVVDMKNEEVFTFPYDCPNYETAMSLLRSHSGDRHSFQEVADGWRPPQDD